MSQTRTVNKPISEIQTSDELIAMLDQVFASNDEMEIIYPLIELLLSQNTQTIVQMADTSDEDWTKTSDYKIISEAINNDEIWRTFATYVTEKMIPFFSIKLTDELCTQAFGNLSYANFKARLNKGFSYFLPSALINMKKNQHIVNLFCNNNSYPINIAHNDNYFFGYDKSSFNALCAALRMLNPRELYLSNIWLPTTFPLPINHAIISAKPTKLVLRNTAILEQGYDARPRSEFIDQLAKVISIAGVEDLDVSWCLLMQGSGQLFEALKQTHISRLNLSFNFLDNNKIEDWIKLKELVASNNITHLDLSGNFFYELYSSDDVFDAFLDVIKQPSLRSVNLSHNKLHRLSENQMQQFIQAIQQSCIHDIILNTPLSELERQMIDNHKITVTKDPFGGFTMSYAEDLDLVDQPTYTIKKHVHKVSENLLPTKIEKAIFNAVAIRHTLKELSAHSLWQQPSAKISQEGDLFFFQSGKVKKKCIPSEVASTLNDFKHE